MMQVMEQEPQQNPQVARKPITWEADEYIHVEKTPDWYWALGLVAVAGAVAAIIYNNVLFAAFILIAAFVLAIQAARRPNVRRFAVTQRGIRIDDTLIPYNSLESFSVDELSPNHTPKLIINPKGVFTSIIVIPIVDVDADDVHDYLAPLLDEDEHTEPLSHRVMEWLGF